MKIGFDAKRAFLNSSGLGYYSRNLLNALMKFHSENDYFLYTPKKNFRFVPEKSSQFIIKSPESQLAKIYSSYWRTKLISKQISNDKLDIYHGLSGELPINIRKTRASSVVTIHDLIFVRFPEYYKSIDRKIYLKKAKHACQVAEKIISISNQTKDDIVNFLQVDPTKIEVIYQGCNPIFEKEATEEDRSIVKNQFHLPKDYLLYVGTIEKRKNLLNLIMSIHHHKISMPLVVIGSKTDYYKSVQNYILKNNLNGIIFLNNIPNEELPVFYQEASCLIYPSVFEGFGIPVLEALFSGTPVITSKGSCFNEAGGPNSIYIDPENVEEIGSAIIEVLSNEKLRESMKIKGLEYAQNFREAQVAQNYTSMYKSLC